MPKRYSTANAMVEDVFVTYAERTAFTYGDRAAEWRRGLYSTVNHHYFNELG